MAGLLVVDAWALLDRPHLFIAHREIEAPDAGEGDRRRAHGAGLERDIEIAKPQTLAAETRRRFPYRQELGMCRRVLQFDGAIARLCHHIARLIDNDTANGDLAALTG